MRMTRVEELRSRYPIFRYESFELERSSSRFVARFNFSIPPGISFAPQVIFEPVPEGWREISEESLHNVVFHLGLIESFSYWKATASPVIEVLAGRLTGQQIGWWEDLLIYGMGEFFYHNDIDFTSAGFLKIHSNATASASMPHAGALPQRS